MYRRVHTPNSPLMPLSPMVNSTTPSMYLSPYTTSIRSRRSFTPCHLNILPPPSLSPIKANILPNKEQKEHREEEKSTPEQKLDSSLITSSAQKSMKTVRSAARIQRRSDVRSNRSLIQLTPVKRSLFAAESTPVIKVDTSHVEAKTPVLLTPNYHRSPRMVLTPAQRSEISAKLSPFVQNGATPGLLEETFTVTSILKEINMRKYASLFAKEEIDLFIFLMLTPDDLSEIGVDEPDRDVIMKAIHCYTEFFSNPDQMCF